MFGECVERIFRVSFVLGVFRCMAPIFCCLGPITVLLYVTTILLVCYSQNMQNYRGGYDIDLYGIRVVQLINKYDAANKVVLESFDPDVL